METFMREFIRHTNKVLEVENIWLLEQEFTDLRDESNELGLSCEIGKKLGNRRKNRYRDILPFDDTRVTLPQLSNDPDSDYINASLVRGATAQHYSYIAAQGPLPHTLGDFWRMLFHYNVGVIVMLCNEREGDKPKCERYWPTANDVMVIDVFDVSKNAEFLESVSRTQSASSDSSWAAGVKGDAASAAFEQQIANGADEDQSEVCVAMHFELKLVKEWTTQANYTMRRIRATKFETLLVWDDPEANKAANGAGTDSGADPSTEAEPNAALYENVEFRHSAKRSPKQVKKSETREFLQYHYRNWADYAAADELESILSMHEALRRHQPSVTVPLCVHCSAGCGRTGTVLFIDYIKTLVKRGLLDRFLCRKAKAPNLTASNASGASSQSLPNAEAKDTTRRNVEYDFERSVEDLVRRIVLEFRKQRPAAVQSFEQYVMCYRATCEIFRQQLALIDDHTYVNLEELRSAANKQTKSANPPTSVNSPVMPAAHNESAQVPTTSHTSMSVSTITLASSTKSIQLDWSTSVQSRSDPLSIALDKMVQVSSISNHLDQIDTITCKNTIQGATPQGETSKSPDVATKLPVVTVTQNTNANANASADLISNLSSKYEPKRHNQPPRSRTPDPERCVPLRNADPNSASNFRDRRTSKDDSFLPQMRLANEKKPGASIVRHLGELKHPVKK